MEDNGQDLQRPARLAVPPLTLQHLWILMIACGLWLVMRQLPIRPQDFWWHIAVGRATLATGMIPSADTFSFTASGRPYDYAAFWLMEVALYRLYQWGGAALVLFAHRMAITATYVTIYLLCSQISRSKSIAFVCWLFAVLIDLSNWNVRPQIIAFPLSAAFLWTIYAYRQQPRIRLLAIFPIGMALWVNSHGSFVMGLIFLGIWLADEAWQSLNARAPSSRFWGAVLAMSSSLLACLANPRGLGTIAYVRTLTGNPMVQRFISEWLPPSFATWSGAAFLLGLLATAVLLAVSPRRPTLFQVLTFAGIGFLGLQTSRVLIWFGMAVAPILAEHLPLVAQAAGHALVRVTRAGDERPERGTAAARVERAPTTLNDDTHRVTGPRLVVNYTLAAILLTGMVMSLPWFGHVALAGKQADLISAETPVAATTFLLETRPPGPVFNAQAFGSYLIWAAQPAYPVFVDPRIDLYPVELWADYAAISGGRADWEQLLARHGVNTLMLDPHEQSELIRVARASRAWRLLYEDQEAVILTRAAGEAQ